MERNRSLCNTESKPFETVLILSRIFYFWVDPKSNCMATVKKKADHPCGWCGKEIPDWRSNKKFCDEEHKNKFFNKRRTEEGLEMRRINRILKKNYEILKRVIKDKLNEKIKLDALVAKGFNIRFLTHIAGEYRNCYNLSWRPIEKGFVIISRPPESMYPETDDFGFTKLLKPENR